MPVYEYRCGQCGHRFEALHAVGAMPGPCPHCAGSVRRIFTSVGLIFKGSGFHTTDYRKPASPNGPAPEAKADAKSEGAPGGEQQKKDQQ